jgi:acyl carrier protein
MTDGNSHHEDLNKRIKEVMIEELMLQGGVDEIADDVPLFDPAGLGLDSVDALQLVVGLEKSFGLKIPDAQAAKGILKNVAAIADAIRAMD